jgi:hypothetical protein
MTDKKSCWNCIGSKSFYSIVCYDGKRIDKNGICPRWQRNPDLWLDIMPTDLGWYWWRPDARSEAITTHIINIGHYKATTKMSGQWQGPIKPEGEYCVCGHHKSRHEIKEIK